MFNLGFPELIFIFLIVLLIFGGKKIPEVARGLGKGIREFKKAKDGLEDDLHDKETAAADGNPAKTPGPATPDKPEPPASGKSV